MIFLLFQQMASSFSCRCNYFVSLQIKPGRAKECQAATWRLSDIRCFFYSAQSENVAVVIVKYSKRKQMSLKKHCPPRISKIA